MSNIRILLLDDHALFREGLSRLLESEPDLKLAALCASINEAVETLKREPIDVVLLDYDLGRERGLEFMTLARDLGFRGRFLMVTAGMSDPESIEALRLGVSGIFLKHSSPSLLTQAIRKVAAGETWLDQSSVRALLDVVKITERPTQARPFTERESSVMQGVLEGLSNKEIGTRLNISESSVKAALQQLFQKTGVRSRSQLVRIALEQRPWRANAR